MAKSCAYCGIKSPLTREHIWPSGFLKRGGFDIKFSARANKTFQGDMTVSDVCAACNNGPLSVLDSHACELYDRRFAKRIEDSDTVTFTYDYGVFMRWLLKISYNSSRTTGWDEDWLASYRDVIRCQYPCSPALVVVFVATVNPLKIVNSSSGQTKTRLSP